jgi:hypothetical protein
LLPLLQVLLLLSVFLFHLLSLLLVPLFYLLLLGFACVPLGEMLVFLFLPLLELLVLLILLLDQLVLLLLVFLVSFGVPRVGRSRVFVGLNLRSVGWRARNVVLGTTGGLRTGCRLLIAAVLRARNIVLGTTRLRAAAFGWRMVWSSCFFRGHCSGAP